MYEDTTTNENSEINQGKICLESVPHGDANDRVIEIYSKTVSQTTDYPHKKIYLRGLKDSGREFCFKTLLSLLFCVFSVIVILRSNENMRDNSEVLHVYLSLKIIAAAISIGLLIVELTEILVSTRAFYGLVPDEEFIWPSENFFVLHVKGLILAVATPVILICGILVHLNTIRRFWCVGHFTSRHIRTEARWWTRVSFASDVLQVYILMILAIFLVFNSERPIDIFVNMVAVQAFSKLDDQTVHAWFQRHEPVIENAKLYFKWKSENGHDIDFEEYHKEVIEPIKAELPCLDSHAVIFNRATINSSSEDNS